MIAGLAAIVFVAFTVQATIGFGSQLISLAIAVLFWPLAEVMPIVVPISLGLSLYLLACYWRFANWRLLLRAVLPCMVLGLSAGMFLAPDADPALLRVLLGVVVTGAALRGLWSMLWGKGSGGPASGRVRLSSLLWIGVAGLVHGMIATGGPPLVYALEGVGMDKKSFRSSLAVVWFLANLALTVRFVLSGTLAPEQGKTLLMLLPVVGLAIFSGEYLHSRVSENGFRLAVFGLLMVAGILLWAPMLWQLV